MIAAIAVLTVSQLAITQQAAGQALLEPALSANCDQVDPDLDLGECTSGCDSCGGDCGTTWGQIKIEKELELADNLGWTDGKFDLIIYQQTNNGKGDADWFQWYASKHLQGKAPTATHVAVSTIAEALAAIKAAFGAAGNNKINVVIVGHGNEGLIKLGEEVLNKGNITDLANVQNMIKRMVLFGCSVGGGIAGQSFTKQLSAYIAAPVKAWTGTVWASSKGLYFEGDKKDIPTVSEWGLAVMALMVLAAGTIVMTRRRTAAA